MSNDKKNTSGNKTRSTEAPAVGRSWTRWILPTVGLVALIFLGLVIRDRLQSEVWSYYTDEEGLRVDVQEKKERMVLWQDPELSLFEERKKNPEDPGVVDPVNQASQSVEAAFSADGTLMVLTRFSSDFEKTSPEETGADLYLSRWDGRTWSRPEAMTALNTFSDERGAAFSRDGQHLYFSSNREGGAGGYDIYVARKDGKSWTKIERLGDSINSAKNETGPAPSTDDRRLYFSTDRVTDRDIYVAQRELPKTSEEAVATSIEPVAIAASSEGWSFTAASGVQGEDWLGAAFDDSKWTAAKAPLGYGEPSVTEKNGTTLELQGQPVLVRRKFSIDQKLLDSKKKFSLRIASDDSATVWINGQQVDKDDIDHEPVYWNRTVKVPAGALKSGENILAARVNNKAGSSDIYFDLVLEAGPAPEQPAEGVAKTKEPETTPQPVFTKAVAVDTLNSSGDDIETALTGQGDHVFLASNRARGKPGDFSLYFSRVVSGEVMPPEKVDVYIREGQATDPAVRMEGFDLLFSSDGELAPQVAKVEEKSEEAGDLTTPKQDYRLYRSTTREVIGYTDRARWELFKELIANIFWWILLGIAALLLLIYLVEKWRDITSLYHKCLAASVMAHLLLLLLMIVWVISQAVAGGDQQAPEVALSIDALAQEELAMESEQELAEVTRSTQLIVAKNVQNFSEVAFNPTVIVPNPVPIARKSSDQSLVSDLKPSKANEAQPSETPILPQKEAPELKELSETELPELLVEELEVATATNARKVEAVDLTRDDFKVNEEAIQQVKSDQEQLDPAKSLKVEVQSDEGSVAKSTRPEAKTENVDPVDGLEANDTPKKTEGTETPLAQNLPGSDPADALTTGLELEVAAVDTTKGDFKGNEGAIQQVKSGKAKTGKAGNKQLDVESGARAVTSAGKTAPATDTGGSTVNPTDGLEAKSAPEELEGSSEKAALALNLPGTDPLDSLVADVKLETPKNSLDVKTLSKYVKKLRGRPSLEVIKQLGGSEATEGAIRMALDWFSDNQEADGRWEMGKHGSRSEYNTAGAGLAMLCYYGWGIKRGANSKHAKALARAIDWLIKQQGPDGNLRGQGGGNHGTYAHGIASIALCEAYGLTKDPKLKEPATRAIQYIINAQDKKGGGWRYQPGQAGDLSATGWHYMALHSGRMAGLDIPDEVFSRGREFISSVSGGTHNGIYGYTGPSNNHPAMTATGMFLRQLDLTPPTDPRQQESSAFLKLRMLKANKVDFYFDYYATLSLYQHQGPIWTEWNNHLKEIYVTLQHKTGANRGSWDPKGKHVNAGGRVLSTGLAVLSLEVYYRLLPMYGFGRDK